MSEFRKYLDDYNEETKQHLAISSELTRRYDEQKLDAGIVLSIASSIASNSLDKISPEVTVYERVMKTEQKFFGTKLIIDDTELLKAWFLINKSYDMTSDNTGAMKIGHRGVLLTTLGKLFKYDMKSNERNFDPQLAGEIYLAKDSMRDTYRFMEPKDIISESFDLKKLLAKFVVDKSIDHPTL